MKSPITVILSGLLLSGVPQQTLACGHSFCAPVKKAAVLVTPVVAVAPVIQVFPLYSVGLPVSVAPGAIPVAPLQPVAVPAQANPAPISTDDRLRKLEEDNKRLRDENEALKKGQQPQAQVAPVNASYIAILKDKCFACHNVKDSVEKGGGFALYNPDLSLRAKFTDKEKFDLMAKLTLGKMPKNDKLDAAQYDKLVDWVTGMK